MAEVIDIHSKGEYPANVLSNFSPNAFEFCGVKCASMEGFLQSLKFRNRKKQAEVCGLAGKAAKKAGGKKFLWKLTGTLYWQGKRYERCGEAFLFLRKSAYEALLCNDTFREALILTKGKTLTHSIGKSNPRTTILTEREFIDYLCDLRAQL